MTVNVKLIEWFAMKTDVRQECVIPPRLFNSLINFVLWKEEVRALKKDLNLVMKGELCMLYNKLSH